MRTRQGDFASGIHALHDPKTLQLMGYKYTVWRVSNDEAIFNGFEPDLQDACEVASAHLSRLVETEPEHPRLARRTRKLPA